jgi:hypothetical protein
LLAGGFHGAAFQLDRFCLTHGRVIELFTEVNFCGRAVSVSARSSSDGINNSTNMGVLWLRGLPNNPSDWRCGVELG